VSHQSSPEKPSTFTSAIPVLPTNTIEQAITFYGQLGFQTLHQDAEYAIFQRDTVELHVWLCTDQSLIENSSCRIKVTNIEGLYQEYQAKGLLEAQASVSLKPWGAKEFVVFDSGRVLITFFEHTH
jgi:hypothetical protein